MEEKEFKVQIYCEGDEYEDFIIKASSYKEAQNIINNIDYKITEDGPFANVEIRSDGKLLYTLEQVGTIDFKKDLESWLDYLVFELTESNVIEIDDFSYHLTDDGVLQIFVHKDRGERLAAEISDCGDKLDGECNDLALTVLQEMDYRFAGGIKK